jgi:hypothetical protein
MSDEEGEAVSFPELEQEAVLKLEEEEVSAAASPPK